MKLSTKGRYGLRELIDLAEGLRSGETLNFSSADGKPHQMHILSIDSVTEEGFSTVRYVLDSEILTCAVKVSLLGEEI